MFNKKIKIKNRIIGAGFPCVIVAEIGPNHNGSFDLALQMIELVARSGCDAVKFQYRNADKEIFDKDTSSYYYNESRYDFIKNVQEFTDEQHYALRERAKSLGLIYICSLMTDSLLDKVIKLKPDFIKIPSGEANNPWLIEGAAKSKIPLVVSSGISTHTEVDKLINNIKKFNVKDFILLHCLSEYPTLLKDINLSVISKFYNKYNCVVGLSDHSREIYAVASSVLLGSAMIEVHFTLSREMKGPDHKVSLEYEELKDLVKNVRMFELAKGSGKKNTGAHVDNMRNTFTNSIVARKKIKPGDILSKENIALKKPGTGLGVEYIDKVIGSKALVDIQKNNPIGFGDFSK